MGEVAEIIYTNGFSKLGNQNHDQSSWQEETIDGDLKWSFALSSVLHKGTSKFQDIALLDTKRFGKVLVIDGKMQSAEIDEFIYHECLIHPALLCHSLPRNEFIMGGGEGSAAREALKHKSVEKVVMCDIDQSFPLLREVVNFCRTYLTVNQDAFCNKKLNLVINDAKAELEKRNDKFDIIIGDSADPVEGGPCYQLYTKSFYKQGLKPKLNGNGITQAGPAGIFTQRRSSHLFTTQLSRSSNVDVVAHSAHVPSFADTLGRVMASDQPFSIHAEGIDRRIEERIEGELIYLNGAAFLSSATLNKTVSQSLLNETHVYTEDDARFIPGHGLGYRT
ncbi:hypothetical protein GH714_037340 [Hevea brasiliensis]|uniref:thermospermine synthase n=1 Tax=Hevea brasiliensis TaxID=3981 RepID=A0A6A6KDR5_HEVBR|nr:hypothetical protein GH714_037340 [Hevea brasiliensis]